MNMHVGGAMIEQDANGALPFGRRRRIDPQEQAAMFELLLEQSGTLLIQPAGRNRSEHGAGNRGSGHRRGDDAGRGDDRPGSNDRGQEGQRADDRAFTLFEIGLRTVADTRRLLAVLQFLDTLVAMAKLFLDSVLARQKTEGVVLETRLLQRLDRS